MKDHAAVTFRFTTTLLKKLPAVVDTNPAKIVLGILKIVLEIKEVRRWSSHRCLADYAYQAVKDNIDAVDSRIISTVDQLRAVERAPADWKPNKEEKRGMELYRTYACLFLRA
jgi:hypothetical protein